MKIKGRRIVAWLLAFAMAFAMQPIGVSAAAITPVAVGDEEVTEYEPGHVWEDPDYDVYQHLEVFPNTKVAHFNNAPTKRFVTTYMNNGREDFESWNPGYAISEDETLVEDGNGIFKDDTLDAVVDGKYIAVLSPTMTVEDEDGEEIVLTPTKIADVNWNVVDGSGKDVTSYFKCTSNKDSDKVSETVGSAQGLRIEYSIQKKSDYTATLSFYANFSIYDKQADAASEQSKWHKFTYTLTGSSKYGFRLYLFDYKENGTEEYMDKDDATRTITWDLTDVEPEAHPGYTFMGWTTERNGSEVTNTDSYSQTWTRIGSDRHPMYPVDDARSTAVLYPVWEDAEQFEHTLSYDLKGGAWRNGVNDQTITQESWEESVKINVTNETPVRSGFTFLGWTDKSDGTTSNVKAGAIIDVPKEGKVLYALWSEVPKEDDKYFIKVWGIPEENQDFTFTGPTEDNPVVITIESDKVNKAGSFATYTFDSSQIDTWFSGYGNTYSTTVQGSVVASENGYHSTATKYTISWDNEDGGTINVVYVLSGFYCQVNYFNQKNDKSPIKSDAVYSGTPITKVTIDPPAKENTDEFEFKGWNLTGNATDECKTEFETNGMAKVDLYAVFTPYQSEYVVKHNYYVIDAAGNKTLEGSISDDPVTDDVGKKIGYNPSSDVRILISPKATAAYEHGEHDYRIEGATDNNVVVKKDETVTYELNYVRDECVGGVTFTVEYSIYDGEGNLQARETKIQSGTYVEGTKVSVDKATGNIVVNGAKDGNGTIELNGVYSGNAFTYEIADASPEVEIAHTNIAKYTVKAEYRLGAANPNDGKTSVTVKHEYYLEDKSGNLTKEGETEETFNNIDVDTVIDKAFHDGKHNPEDAIVYEKDGMKHTYREYELTQGVKATADGKAVLTIKYKRAAAVKFTVRHEYYLLNEGSTRLLEKTDNVVMEGEPGQRICCYPSAIGVIKIDQRPTTQMFGTDATYVYASCSPEMEIAADGSTVYNIQYERRNTGTETPVVTTTSYTVNHEYYLIDANGNQTKEGTFTETGTGTVGGKIGMTSDGTQGYIVINPRYVYTVSGMTYTYTKFQDEATKTIAEGNSTIYTIKYMRQNTTDGTRLGSYKVYHDLYKQNDQGVWTLERRVEEDVKMAAVGSVVGVKTEGNTTVTVGVEKKVFKETSGNKVKEYQFQTATNPVTLEADKMAEIILTYHYNEYDVVPAQQPTGSGNNTQAPESNDAPKTGDNFRMSAMMPLSGLVSLVCIGGLVKGKKKEEDQ